MYTNCDLCHKSIDFGEPHHTVNLHRERAFQEEVDIVITVDDAETLLTTCISCGRNLHKAAISKVLAADSPEKAKMFGELFIPLEVN